jgi:hypothetical protein
MTDQMSRPDRVRQALAMQDAGYHTRLDHRDVEALLMAYDEACTALRKCTLAATVDAQDIAREFFRQRPR